MSEDERAIRDLVERWMSASIAGDRDAVLALMTDDVVFTVPGAEPFGKEEFAASFDGMQGVEMSGTNDIRELKILGDWAFIRNYVDVTVGKAGTSDAIHRQGYTLTLLRKEQDGQWRLARDANLVS